MESSYNKINFEVLYKEAKAVALKVYKKFTFLNLTNEQIDKIVKEELIKIKNNNSNENFEQNLTIKFKKILKMKLNDKEECLKIINTYINNNPHKFKTNNNLEFLKNIDAFFSKNNLILDPDIIILLIENISILNKKLEIIIKQNRKYIDKDSLDLIIKEQNIILFIETYCMLNDIQMGSQEETEELEIENISIDSVKTYLIEIGQKPLLSLEEERDLAYRILNNDEDAKNILIERNLRLVVKVARRYLSSGMPFLDLIQEGNLGLMKAAEKYDVRKGYKFSTYATHWIRQSIARAIHDKLRNIRVPVHLQEKLAAFNSVRRELSNVFNREPTIEEIAFEMNISVEKVKKFIELQMDTVSINTFISDTEDSELEDFIPDKKYSTEEEAILNTMKTEIFTLLDKCNLKSREKDILIERYGLNGKEPKTLEEVGSKYNVTRERIRQLEASAINKIRNSKYIKSFAEYMEEPDRANERIDYYRAKSRENNNNYKKLLTNEIMIEQPKTVERKKENKENMAGKSQSIYILFKDYTKDEVDKMISKLDEEDKKILTIKYGDDLKNPKPTSKYNKDIRLKFYNNLLPKMRNLLANPNYKSNQTKTKKLQTIYDYFKEYTREQINDMLSKLTEEEFNWIKLRYGKDLDRPQTAEGFTIEVRNKFYGSLIPKMKRLLANPEGKRKPRTKTTQENHSQKVSNFETPKIISKTEYKLEEQQTTLSSKSKESKNQNINKENYKQLLELLRTPSFAQMMNVLSPQEAIIIALKLGYVDEKYFSTKSIANFLEIEEDEVRETTKKILVLYKENINELIDEVVDIATEQRKILINEENK